MNERCDKCGIDLTDIAVNRPKIATFYSKNENGERDHIGYHKLKLCDHCYRYFQKPYRDIKNNYTRSVINLLENEEINMTENEKIARASMTIFKTGVCSAKRYISYIDGGTNPIYAIDDLPGYSFSYSSDYLSIYVWMDTDEGGQYKGHPILKVLPAAMVVNSSPDYKKDRDKVMKLLEYQAWTGL